MKTNIGIITLLMLMTIAVGCGGSGGDTPEPEPEDTLKPEMAISAPSQGATVLRGTDLQLSGVFTDDMDLESLIVTLSFNSTKASTGINDPWEPSGSPETIVLSGKREELNKHNLFGEMIPADCKVGNYVLQLELKDKSGKETSHQIDIVIGG